MIVAAIIVGGIITIAALVIVGILIDEGRITFRQPSKGVEEAAAKVAMAEANAKVAYYTAVEQQLLEARSGDGTALKQLAEAVGITPNSKRVEAEVMPPPFRGHH